MRVFYLAAAANVVDIGRHRPKLISATRPFGHSATRPRRHVSFLDKPLENVLFWYSDHYYKKLLSIILFLFAIFLWIQDILVSGFQMPFKCQTQGGSGFYLKSGLNVHKFATDLPVFGIQNCKKSYFEMPFGYSTILCWQPKISTIYVVRELLGLKVRQGRIGKERFRYLD